MNKPCNAVFEGGGIKGIGLVGAVTAMEKAGYTFINMAGTSVGAIVASLLSAGYSGLDIKEILQGKDYLKFKDKGLLDKVGVFGKLLSILFQYGIYEGQFFETWLDALLKSKGVQCFGDLKYYDARDEKFFYKFQCIASDLTDRRMLILPGDLKYFGIDPDQFNIAKAVRMSMSIPLFFEPVRLTDSAGRKHMIVDGGILSNYPIWLLDDGYKIPPWPTFGLKLVSSSNANSQNNFHKPIHNIQGFLASLIGTMMDAHDRYHISVSKGDFARTIAIPTTVTIDQKTKNISTTDFAITAKEQQALFLNGMFAATAFLEKWNFEAWKKTYRRNQIYLRNKSG